MVASRRAQSTLSVWWDHGVLDLDVELVDLPDRTLGVRRLPGQGPRVVLIHGLGGSSLNWVDLMPLLTAAGPLDLTAVDLPGFGVSPPPRDGDYRPQGHARAVADLIDRGLDGSGPVHLFGNSLGGAVAVQLAARRPDLVASATLISPALPRLRPRRDTIHMPVIAIPGVGERLTRRYLALDPRVRALGTIDVCFADPRRLAPERLATLTAEVEQRDALPYTADATLSSLRGLLGTFLDSGPNRPWRLAERIEAPVLVVYGREDRLVDSRAAHRITRHFRDADVHVLPDCGHVAQMEHPERVARTWLHFLSSRGL